MTENHRGESLWSKHIKLGGEGTVVPKREYPGLKSRSAATGLEGLGELHLEMQQTHQGGTSSF